MKDDWRVLDPALPPEPVPGASLEKAAAEALAAGDDLENMRFLEGELCGLSGKNLDVRGCVFERCRFGENDLKRVSFVDCVFDRCEWSNARLENAALQRVGFRGCRMTGLEVLGGALMSAAFEGCMLDYASFSECKPFRIAACGKACGPRFASSGRALTARTSRAPSGCGPRWRAWT